LPAPGHLSNILLLLYFSNLPHPLFKKEGKITLYKFSYFIPPFLKGDIGGLLIFIIVEIQ